MQTLEHAFNKANHLPTKVNGLSETQLKRINSEMIRNGKKKTKQRGAYTSLSAPNKLRVARYCYLFGVAKTLNKGSFAEFRLKESSVIGWKNKFAKAVLRLKRHPKNAKEANLVPLKRGRRSCLGEENKATVVAYLKELRASGTDITCYTTAAAVKAILVSQNKSHLLTDKGGWIDPFQRGLHQELWKKCNFVKRKKCKKRRNKTKGNPAFIASQYKLRCALTKQKYHIHDALDFNCDESFVAMVPVGGYTMEEKGSTEVRGEAIDDKRGVTGFFLGAKTGEGGNVQLIYEGKTERCHPPGAAPRGVVYDHSDNHWSDPDTTQHFVEQSILPFYESQRNKYHLPYGSHCLLRWDVYYSHRLNEIVAWLRINHPYIHLVYVPANYTDELQQMDVAVNGPLKSKLKQNFTNWRCTQSVQQMRNGVSASDVYVEYGLKALKSIHVKWVLSAWTYCIENGHIAKGFETVEKNLVGYDAFDESMIGDTDAITRNVQTVELCDAKKKKAKAKAKAKPKSKSKKKTKSKQKNTLFSMGFKTKNTNSLELEDDDDSDCVMDLSSYHVSNHNRNRNNNQI